jgi:predicted  nucleic acid-binding Zn ribbon protein
MFIAEVSFTFPESVDNDIAAEAIDHWTSALRMNGQVLGREMPLAREDSVYRTWLMIPAVDSLDPSHNNKWVTGAEERIYRAGLLERREQLLGEVPDAAAPCVCGGSISLILFIFGGLLESPVRCGDCFGPIPLYTLPPTYDSEYSDLICWQSDYQACDQLQMNCKTGERFGLRQMGQVDSSLTLHGREVCRKLEAGAGKPVYYYLHRYYGRSARLERERRCPGCGGEWRLYERLHDRFDFRCDACRLLAKMADLVNGREWKH